MKKILILDHDKHLAVDLSRRLQSDTVHVICCDDSETAANLLQKISVDALIADDSVVVQDPQRMAGLIRVIELKDEKTPIVRMSSSQGLNKHFRIESHGSLDRVLDLDELIAHLRSHGLQVGEGRTPRPVFYHNPCEAIFPC